VRVAVDAMGGDLAPREVVRGAVLGASRFGCEVVLTGPAGIVESEVLEARRRLGIDEGVVEVVDAPEVIGPDEAPVEAVRRKARSSLCAGIDLVSRGEAEGFLSAGNTGAIVAAALLRLRRIRGVDRPALASFFPTISGKGCLVLDLGASVDVRPEALAQFGTMGSVYARLVTGTESPRVALLNVGTEPRKGSERIRAAYDLLARSDLNFVGNVEGRDVFFDAADVIVCDGFVGNVLLKHTEGVVEAFYSLMRRSFSSRVSWRLLARALRPAFREIKRRLDYTEYGGAPLLGVRGIVIKSHGSSNAKAIANGLRVVASLAGRELLEEIAGRRRGVEEGSGR